ncbi:cell wall-binding repeat-containing protein [Bacillus sp. 2205SS5-2]|uniref:cell wall-binding repeat-containing protein n=1 Tax=Bacillus sp. 2205SS5-2 TaxID=3109031 RepID=UPI0030049F02
MKKLTGFALSTVLALSFLPGVANGEESVGLQGYTTKNNPFSGPLFLEEEKNDTRASANQIQLGDFVNGEKTLDDQDVYSFTVEKEGYVSLQGMSVNPSVGLGDTVKFSLHDDSEQEEGSFLLEAEFYQDDEGNYLSYFEEYLEPGKYYISVGKGDEMYDEYVFTISLSVPYLRLSGMDRYETAVNISELGWESSTHAILATGENFPDALSATPLAQKHDAPLLLTNKNSLPSSVKGELDRLGVKDIIIVGGKSVITEAVENDLEKLGINVKRISGQDRYETAVKIAEEVGHDGEVVVATGKGFADALSIAPIAASKGMPILLTDKEKTPAVVSDYLKKSPVQKTYVIGGKAVIGETVKNTFTGNVRISGINRYDTNKQIIKYFQSDINMEDLFITTGQNFPDALAGSALAVQYNNPLILTSTTPAKETTDIISDHKDEIKIFIALGGEKALPIETIIELNEYWK